MFDYSNVNKLNSYKTFIHVCFSLNLKSYYHMFGLAGSKSDKNLKFKLNFPY